MWKDQKTKRQLIQAGAKQNKINKSKNYKCANYISTTTAETHILQVKHGCVCAPHPLLPALQRSADVLQVVQLLQQLEAPLLQLSVLLLLAAPPFLPQAAQHPAQVGQWHTPVGGTLLILFHLQREAEVGNCWLVFQTWQQMRRLDWVSEIFFLTDFRFYSLFIVFFYSTLYFLALN